MSLRLDVKHTFQSLANYAAALLVCGGNQNDKFIVSFAGNICLA